MTLFLHNLLTEDDHAWLRSLTTEPLDDEETKVLIYARATGAVDNTACRDFSGLDTLTASRVLRRLRDKGLLDKQGGGNRTYYVLRHPSQLASLNASSAPSASGASANTQNLSNKNHSEHATLLATLAGRASAVTLRDAIVRFCTWRALSVDELATLLSRKRDYLRNKHLIPMVREGQLHFRYPESAKHPHKHT